MAPRRALPRSSTSLRGTTFDYITMAVGVIVAAVTFAAMIRPGPYSAFHHILAVLRSLPDLSAPSYDLARDIAGFSNCP